MPAVSTKFCPRCSSALVEFSALEGGGATCRGCSWQGTNAELRAVPFEHAFSSDEEVVQAFSAELRNTLARHAGTQLGQLLIKWGFLEQKGTKEEMTKNLSRLLAALSRGAVTAVIDERVRIEQEAVSHG